MTDHMTLEEYHEYNRTGRMPRRFNAQTRSALLNHIAEEAPDLLDEAAGTRRANKYGNVKTVVDGYTFDSKAEADRYSELKQLMLGGLVANLELQPKFDLTVQGVKIGTYSADFRYQDLEKGVQVVEDVKSESTAKNPLFRWKKKHVKAQYGIEVQEIQM